MINLGEKIQNPQLAHLEYVQKNCKLRDSPIEIKSNWQGNFDWLRSTIIVATRLSSINYQIFLSKGWESTKPLFV